MKSKKNYLREEYLFRINRTIDYIEKHISDELTLELLSKAANFSKYHFHRIFTTIIGEPIFQFIQRVRLEKAATKLALNSGDSITKIAYDFGFSSSSTFARAFKNHFKMSASQWIEECNSVDSKNCKLESNQGKEQSNEWKDVPEFFEYSVDRNYKILESEMKEEKYFSEDDFEVKIENFEDMHVAYVRHVGAYAGDGQLFEKMFNKLFTWAGSRNLINFPDTKVISIYHDNPGITEEDKQRTSMCITVPEGTVVTGEVGIMKIESGRYAVARFELNVNEYAMAWETVYGKWLPESGYVPDDKPCFEMYQNDPKEHPEGKHIVDICIPVKPL